jgi:hypothetical protein
LRPILRFEPKNAPGSLILCAEHIPIIPFRKSQKINPPWTGGAQNTEMEACGPASGQEIGQTILQGCPGIFQNIPEYSV